MATLKVGVIGYPLGHTLSPLIHNYWCKNYGFDGLYQAVEIVPDNFESSVSAMVGEGYLGFNVTLPYKQRILDLCDSIDETARRIGAVNTVVVSESKKLRGMNTDAFGFVENILHADAEIDLSGQKAAVLGAGGAARAIVHGLQSMGAAEIIVTNRTKEKAEDVAAAFGVGVADWTERESICEDAAFLVNTTSLGMQGQLPLEFDVSCLPKQAAVCDIVYKPLETELLKDAKDNGNAVITGIGMLLHQARPAFREWFGVMPEVDNELQREILEGI